MATVSDITNTPQSGFNHIDSLINTLPDWNYQEAAPANTLFYTFDAVNDTRGEAGISAFNDAQKNAARAIMADVAAITGIILIETANGNAADFHFANDDVAGDPTTAGLCVSQHGWVQDQDDNISGYAAESWIYLDNNEHAAANTTPTAGGVGYETLLHEIGHAFGLKHSFETTGDNPNMLPVSEDNTSNTVMSYTHLDSTSYSSFRHYDIAALNFLYGRDGLLGSRGVGTNSAFLTGLFNAENLDTNNDGNNDLMWRQDNVASGPQAWWLDLRDGKDVGAGSNYQGYAGWNLVDTSGDYNGDGRTDQLWKNEVLSGAQGYWMDLKNGSQNTGSGYLGYAGWTLVDAGADLNGDNRGDLIWKNDSVNGANAYFVDLKNGLGNIAGGGYLGYAGWTLWDATGDFNGDGRTDLIWKQDGASGANSFWMDLKNGTGNIAGGGYFGYAGWLLVDAAADLNGDGNTDLLWKENGTSRYWVDLMNDGIATLGAGYLGYTGWTLVDAGGDMNGDGRTDLIWKNNSVNGANAYWVDFMNGATSVGGGYLGYNGFTLADAADDFNGDGTSDLLWRQDAGGLFWLDLKNGMANVNGGGFTGYNGWSPIDPEILTATVDVSLI